MKSRCTKVIKHSHTNYFTLSLQLSVFHLWCEKDECNDNDDDDDDDNDNNNDNNNNNDDDDDDNNKENLFSKRFTMTDNKYEEGGGMDNRITVDENVNRGVAGFSWLTNNS